MSDELRGLVATPPSDIDDVIARLTAVEKLACTWAPRGEDNGIACFSRLYLEITQGVKDAYDAGTLFHCGRFILELDVAFAARYLAALHAWARGGTPSPPRCWGVLFEHQHEDVPPWRFAAAGVNAHVNFDLAFALLDVWEAHPVPLAATDAQRADYQAINQIFYTHMEKLCESFDAFWSFPGGTDHEERAGTVLGNMLVLGTRDVAWRSAEIMWTLRHVPHYRAGQTELLDWSATRLGSMVI